jgi:hypothetical protein
LSTFYQSGSSSFEESEYNRILQDWVTRPQLRWRDQHTLQETKHGLIHGDHDDDDNDDGGGGGDDDDNDLEWHFLHARCEYSVIRALCDASHTQCTLSYT